MEEQPIHDVRLLYEHFFETIKVVLYQSKNLVILYNSELGFVILNNWWVNQRKTAEIIVNEQEVRRYAKTGTWIALEILSNK